MRSCTSALRYPLLSYSCAPHVRDELGVLSEGLLCAAETRVRINLRNPQEGDGGGDAYPYRIVPALRRHTYQSTARSDLEFRRKRPRTSADACLCANDAPNRTHKRCVPRRAHPTGHRENGAPVHPAVYCKYTQDRGKWRRPTSYVLYTSLTCFLNNVDWNPKTGVGHHISL
jgi:hypothetical protein